MLAGARSLPGTPDRSHFTHLFRTLCRVLLGLVRFVAAMLRFRAAMEAENLRPNPARVVTGETHGREDGAALHAAPWYAEAWSPPTSGVLTGAPIYVGDSTIEEIDKLGSRLRNAIVLTARPQIEFLGKDRPEPSQATDRCGRGILHFRAHPAERRSATCSHLCRSSGRALRLPHRPRSTGPCASRAVLLRP